jgi:hypothetical protein
MVPYTEGESNPNPFHPACGAMNKIFTSPAYKNHE